MKAGTLPVCHQMTSWWSPGDDTQWYPVTHEYNTYKEQPPRSHIQMVLCSAHLTGRHWGFVGMKTLPPPPLPSPPSSSFSTFLFCFSSSVKAVALNKLGAY